MDLTRLDSVAGRKSSGPQERTADDVLGGMFDLRKVFLVVLPGRCDSNSSKEERDYVRLQNRQEYEDLRKECQKLLRLCEKNWNPKEDRGDNNMEGSNDFSQVLNPIVEEDDASSRRSCSLEKEALLSFQTKGQACYEVLQSSNTVGNDNWSKDSVLRYANTGPAAGADIPGDHKLDSSVNNTGEHLQKSGNEDFQREDMMVERNMEKPENLACQPVSTGTDMERKCEATHAPHMVRKEHE